eukprot:TRINITY_DN3386_c0_g1_i4.p1 TRINITY_DN3386_c0_g1~~TRINITY_DN3386_c0_g1_i4.p1  ORF type:complete len:464 (-),score=116.90 TRINITY_DN3386_c0_g1_i4:2248-3639(-)
MRRGFFNKKETPAGSEVKTIETLRKQLTEHLHIKNDMNTAEKLCSEILGINPYLHEYLLKRALIRETLGKDNDALKDAALYQYMHPFNLEALSLQARLLEKTGSHAAALRVLKLLMAFDKDDLLKEEYEKMQAMAKKVKKKKKKSKPTKEKETQVTTKDTSEMTYEATLDEDGAIILEEENMLKNTKGSATPTEETDTETSSVLKYGIICLCSVEGYLAEGLTAALKVNVCERCALLADYTKTCSHYDLFSEKDVQDLTQMQDTTKAESTYQSKVKNLKSITRTLEVLSARRETAICLLSSQFYAVLFPFVNGSLEKLFPSSGWSCAHCVGTVSPLVHALIVIGRGLKHYLDIHTQHLTKGEKTFTYEVDENTLGVLVDCFVTHGIEVSMSILKLQFKEYIDKQENVRLMAILMRIFADLIPLGISTYSQMISGIMIKFLENFFGMVREKCRCLNEGGVRCVY